MKKKSKNSGNKNVIRAFKVTLPEWNEVFSTSFKSTKSSTCPKRISSGKSASKKSSLKNTSSPPSSSSSPVNLRLSFNVPAPKSNLDKFQTVNTSVLDYQKRNYHSLKEDFVKKTEFESEIEVGKQSKRIKKSMKEFLENVVTVLENDKSKKKTKKKKIRETQSLKATSKEDLSFCSDYSKSRPKSAFAETSTSELLTENVYSNKEFHDGIPSRNNLFLHKTRRDYFLNRNGFFASPNQYNPSISKSLSGPDKSVNNNKKKIKKSKISNNNNSVSNCLRSSDNLSLFRANNEFLDSTFSPPSDLETTDADIHFQNEISTNAMNFEGNKYFDPYVNTIRDESQVLEKILEDENEDIKISSTKSSDVGLSNKTNDVNLGSGETIQERYKSRLNKIHNQNTNDMQGINSNQNKNIYLTTCRDIFNMRAKSSISANNLWNTQKFNFRCHQPINDQHSNNMVQFPEGRFGKSVKLCTGCKQDKKNLKNPNSKTAEECTSVNAGNTDLYFKHLKKIKMYERLLETHRQQISKVMETKHSFENKNLENADQFRENLGPTNQMGNQNLIFEKPVFTKAVANNDEFDKSITAVESVLQTINALSTDFINYCNDMGEESPVQGDNELIQSLAIPNKLNEEEKIYEVEFDKLEKDENPKDLLEPQTSRDLQTFDAMETDLSKHCNVAKLSSTKIEQNQTVMQESVQINDETFAYELESNNNDDKENHVKFMQPQISSGLQNFDNLEIDLDNYRDEQVLPIIKNKLRIILPKVSTLSKSTEILQTELELFNYYNSSQLQTKITVSTCSSLHVLQTIEEESKPTEDSTETFSEKIEEVEKVLEPSKSDTFQTNTDTDYLSGTPETIGENSKVLKEVRPKVQDMETQKDYNRDNLVEKSVETNLSSEKAGKSLNRIDEAQDIRSTDHILALNGPENQEFQNQVPEQKNVEDKEVCQMSQTSQIFKEEKNANTSPSLLGSDYDKTETEKLIDENANNAATPSTTQETIPYETETKETSSEWLCLKPSTECQFASTLLQVESRFLKDDSISSNFRVKKADSVYRIKTCLVDKFSVNKKIEKNYLDSQSLKNMLMAHRKAKMRKEIQAKRKLVKAAISSYDAEMKPIQEALDLLKENIYALKSRRNEHTSGDNKISALKNESSIKSGSRKLKELQPNVSGELKMIYSLYRLKQNRRKFFSICNSLEKNINVCLTSDKSSCLIQHKRSRVIKTTSSNLDHLRHVDLTQSVDENSIQQQTKFQNHKQHLGDAKRTNDEFSNCIETIGKKFREFIQISNCKLPPSNLFTNEYVKALLSNEIAETNHEDSSQSTLDLSNISKYYLQTNKHVECYKNDDFRNRTDSSTDCFAKEEYMRQYNSPLRVSEKGKKVKEAKSAEEKTDFEFDINATINKYLNEYKKHRLKGVEVLYVNQNPLN